MAASYTEDRGQLYGHSLCVHARCAVAGMERDRKSNYTGTKHSISGLSREGESLGWSRFDGSSSLYVARFTFTMGPDFGGLPPQPSCMRTRTRRESRFPPAKLISR